MSGREPGAARKRRDSAAAAAIAVVDTEQGSQASAGRRTGSFVGKAGSRCIVAGVEGRLEAAANPDIQYTAAEEEPVRSPWAGGRNQSVAVEGTAVAAAGALLPHRTSLHIVAGPVEGYYCRRGTSWNSSTYWAVFIASPEAAKVTGESVLE